VVCLECGVSRYGVSRSVSRVCGVSKEWCVAHGVSLMWCVAHVVCLECDTTL